MFATDDPYCGADRAAQLAAQWGAVPVPLPSAGHVNADSGLGDWPAGLALLQALAQRAGVALPATGA